MNPIRIGSIGDRNGSLAALDLGSELSSGVSLWMFINCAILLHVLVRIEDATVAARSARDEEMEINAIFQLVFWTSGSGAYGNGEEVETRFIEREEEKSEGKIAYECDTKELS